MKLSISNIGWSAKNDLEIYNLMRSMEFKGLEIAPTRIFPDRPYEKLNEAVTWSKALVRQYGFSVSSMQSIWYGRQENVFASASQRRTLVEYTKKAIDFAVMIGCKNLVFGCPRNRSFVGKYDPEIAVNFFKKIGDYAAGKGTTIGMEANPTIYNTNFINDTKSAFELIELVGSEGFKLNLDIGTVIYNEENIAELSGKVNLISHVHISEPGLKPIEKRQLHSNLRDILMKENYQGFVSIEMGKVDDLSVLKEKMRYVRDQFGNV